MHLLIVHHDAEVGEQLVRMVKDYTSHEADYVHDDAAAIDWARARSYCRLLLTQLHGPGIDGLALGGSLSEIFPGLQTLFLPAYPADEQRVEVSNTKVFPEPIDGERLLQALERASAAPNGAPDFFHVMDILQMCCLSYCNGAVQIVKRGNNGIVFLRSGKIVHAESATMRGTAALLEIATWESVEFAYDPSAHAEETIAMPWDEALVQTVVRRKEAKASGAIQADGTEGAPAETMDPKSFRRRLFGLPRKN